MAQFESTLERDLFILLEFDPLVRSFEEQPVRIDFRDVVGKCRSYTPDALVIYHDFAEKPKLPPELLEVKYTEELTAKREEFQPRFDAAETYVLELGWRFRVVTEKEIRTPRLDNANLLLPFRSTVADERCEMRWLRALDSQGPCTIREIMAAIATSDEDRGALLPALWRMVASGVVEADLDHRIGPDTMLSLAGSV